MAAKVRVNVFANDPALRTAGGKVLLIPNGAEWSTVLVQAAAKLGFPPDKPAKRIFTDTGAEVEAADEVMQNDVLYVSMGEDYGQSASATVTPDEAPAGSSAQVPPAPSYAWVCVKCTFQNEAGRASCEICEAAASAEGEGVAVIVPSFIGSSGTTTAAAPAPPVEEKQNEQEDEAREALPVFLRKVRAPTLPGEEEAEYDDDDDEEYSDDDDEDDGLWYDYQEYEDWMEAQRLQAEIAKQLEEQDQSLMECPICLEEQPLPQMYFIEACLHTFCMDCLRMHLDVAVKDGGIVRKDATEVVKKGRVVEVAVNQDHGIRCPASACTNVLTYNEIRHCATGIVFERFEQILLTRTIDGANDMKWCPKSGCGNAIFRSGRSDKVAVCSNPECQYTFCFECGQASHTEFNSCSEYSAFIEEMQATMSTEEFARFNPHLASGIETATQLFNKWARNQDLRFCPNCWEVIEKNEGCDHMFCTRSDAKHAYGKNGTVNQIFHRKRNRRKAARRAGLVKPKPNPIPVPTAQASGTPQSTQRVSSDWAPQVPTHPRPPPVNLKSEVYYCPSWECRTLVERPPNTPATAQLRCNYCDTTFSLRNAERCFDRDDLRRFYQRKQGKHVPSTHVHGRRRTKRAVVKYKR